VMPLMLYVPPARSWRNKFGKEFTFDDAVRELLSRPIERSPCAGTHRLTALAVMLRVDAEVPVLSEAVRAEVREHLRVVVRTLTECQRPQGFWEPSWFQELPGARPLMFRNMTGTESEVLATGHHLEWLMLLPPDMQPPPEVFARGARWLTKVLLEESKDNRWVAANYCPVIHAARSVLVLAEGEGPK
jgi:hypothetical protein